MLAVPLLRSQIEAAVRLQQVLGEGAPAERALDALNERFPSFDLESSLLKTAALNQLYYTNVRAVMRMARHVHMVMNGMTSLQTNEIVEALAHLPKSQDGQRQMNHISFALKFAHFFIDSERFAIYDSFAAKMLRYHLGATGASVEVGNTYSSFLGDLRAVKHHGALNCSTRELDKYLWLAGLYRQWKAVPHKPRINVDAEKLFVTATGEVKRDLQLMAGDN